MKVPASTASGVSDAEMTVQSSALDGQTPSVLQVQPAALAAATGTEALSTGPGGPILVVTSATDPFSDYSPRSCEPRG